MKIVKIVIISLFFILSSKTENAFALNMPKKIKVIKDSGISVRETIQSSSNKIDNAYYNYEYDVLDVNPAYYKIQDENGVQGWIYNNTLENWTEKLENSDTIRINLETGITMRSEPCNPNSDIVGLAEFGELYKILDVKYSHFKIETPNVERGWIYSGRNDDKWVIILDDNLTTENQLKKKTNNFVN